MTTTLDHVFWIGGSPCAGKSTIAHRLAAAHDLQSYSCDDAWDRHLARADPVQTPHFAQVATLDCDGIWMQPVSHQVEREVAIYREEFAFILEDLRALPTDRRILAEGCALLPDLLAQHGIPANRSLWIVPTPAFQLKHYAQRDWIGDVVATCTNPRQAWQNWMDRDIGFGQEVATTARHLGRTVLTVDGSQPIVAVEHQVATHFGLPTGPATRERPGRS